MDSPSPRRPFARPRRIAIGAAILAGALLAACAGSDEPRGPTMVPATQASATPAPATDAPRPTATPEPSPQPTPPPYAFDSTAYGYGITLPGVSVAKQALQPWDGEKRIDWVGPFTDQVLLPDAFRFFVYGTATDLDRDAFVQLMLEQAAEWHDCPAVPTEVRELAVGETMGLVARMRCTGDAYVQKLMLVRDGRGLVVNLLAGPEVDPATANALFEELVAALRWPA